MSAEQQAQYKKDNSAGAGTTLNVFAAIEGGVNAYNKGAEIVNGIANLGKTPETGDVSTDINSGLTPEQIEAQEKAKAEAEAEAKRQAEWEAELARISAEADNFDWGSLYR